MQTPCRRRNGTGKPRCRKCSAAPRNLSSSTMSDSEGGTTIDPRYHTVIASLYYLRFSKRQILDDYTTFMDASIRRARNPHLALSTPVLYLMTRS